jgi:hypothetical protein
MPVNFADRTPEQVKAALEAARLARVAKSELLHDIKSGRVTLGELLSESYRDNVRAQKLSVKTALRALPGVGVVKADHAMKMIGIPETRKIGGLGPRQREALLDWRDSQ